jgi:hypothetical protein
MVDDEDRDGAFGRGALKEAECIAKNDSAEIVVGTTVPDASNGAINVIARNRGSKLWGNAARRLGSSSGLKTMLMAAEYCVWGVLWFTICERGGMNTKYGADQLIQRGGSL